ncbi:MAG: hypothetical protein K2G67_07515 [Muribaculaceae bacterium]|nr:hypothetical protein [Muribaculaceae bacterium]
MRSLIYTLLAILSFVLLTAGCNDTCLENRNALPLAGFYAQDAEGVLQQVEVDSLAVTGVGMEGDSLLSAKTQTKSQLYMPFRIDSDRTQYAFIAYSDYGEARDTVTFEYTRLARLASAECGVSYIFQIHEIRTQGVLFDSVVCPKGFIDNENIENLQIYMRTE